MRQRRPARADCCGSSTRCSWSSSTRRSWSSPSSRSTTATRRSRCKGSRRSGTGSSSRTRSCWKAAPSALFFSPLVIPYLVFGISLLLLFTLVDKILKETAGVYIGLGLHAVVIGHVVVTLPYVILVIMPLLERLSISLDEAAHDLGAGTWQTFRRVTLPLLTPALFSAFLIAFTLSFDEFAIASFLVGTQPTWPVYLFAQLRVPSQLPQVIAVSSVILFASLIVVLLAEVIRRVVEGRYGAEYAARGLA